MFCCSVPAPCFVIKYFLSFIRDLCSECNLLRKQLRNVVITGNVTLNQNSIVLTRSFSATLSVCQLQRIIQMWTKCLYLEERLFFKWFGQPLSIGFSGLCTSPVVSVESRRGCIYCECVHSEPPSPFISFFIEVDVVSEHKATPGNRGEEMWGDIVEWASFLCLWIRTIYFPICLSENCYIYIFLFCVCLFYCFALTSAFTCTVAAKVSFL